MGLHAMIRGGNHLCVHLHQAEYGIGAERLNMVFGGDVLDDSQTVQELGLQHETGAWGKVKSSWRDPSLCCSYGVPSRTYPVPSSLSPSPSPQP
jgi:hypothetical protein